jgi:hypothetical protein
VNDVLATALELVSAIFHESVPTLMFSSSGSIAAVHLVYEAVGI